jgi:DALR anticodon binding domain
MWAKPAFVSERVTYGDGISGEDELRLLGDVLLRPSGGWRCGRSATRRRSPGPPVAAAPHRLCTYLYELATTFTESYENRPVLTASTDDVSASGLALSDLTARVLRPRAPPARHRRPEQR